MKKPTHVVIVYKTLPHYRAEFFELLRAQLREDSVELTLVVGQPDSSLSQRHDTADLPWAVHVRNRYFALGWRRLIWQPVIGIARKADVVVVEQASKLMVNILFMLWRRVGGPRYCLWGHGRNLDARSASRVGEWWKRHTLRACDWWFAYTEGTARFVVDQGFDPKRVTVVQNAIDTRRLQALRAGLTSSERQEAREALDIRGDAQVAVFIGSIYAGKRPGFLLEAADLIRTGLPDFVLLVIGDGPDRDLLERAAQSRPWLKVLGPMRDQQLVAHASLASVLLMPGLVGLAVLDSFALELPMITSAVANHSPEIEYLEHGTNGLIVQEAESASAYADAVVSTLGDETLIAYLRAGCRAAAQRYTVEVMVERFRQGVLALAAEV